MTIDHNQGQNLFSVFAPKLLQFTFKITRMKKKNNKEIILWNHVKILNTISDHSKLSMKISLKWSCDYEEALLYSRK